MKSIAKSAASVVVSLLLATSACVARAEEAKPAAAKPDLAKGQTIATNVCAACHVFDGSRGSPAYPILQGQHPSIWPSNWPSSSPASAATRS